MTLEPGGLRLTVRNHLHDSVSFLDSRSNWAGVFACCPPLPMTLEPGGLRLTGCNHLHDSVSFLDGQTNWGVCETKSEHKGQSEC